MSFALAQEQFPFESMKMGLPGKEDRPLELAFVDEGEGDSILCLHGNPTWSFYFRRLIQSMKEGHRVLAPDHIGFGRSSKPASYNYQLKQHISNLDLFIQNRGLKRFTMVLHDWGGAIGLGWAVRHPERIKRLILLNTAAFLSKDIPLRIRLCKFPWARNFLIGRLNGFARAAVYMASHKRLSPGAKEGLLFPYQSYPDRIGIINFVKDIPLSPEHPSYALLKEIDEKLHQLTCPKLLLWGMKDFCFHAGFLERWKHIYPDAQVETFPQGGHYLLEDEPDQVLASMERFLKKHEHC